MSTFLGPHLHPLRDLNHSLSWFGYTGNGGYVSGGAGNDGNDLITAANGGVVVVQIQYRVGLFGFLAGKKVKEGGVLNAGLLDQQFALQWVQRHIHKFGGDPRQVTIWGQSAGAGSVVQHLVANGGNTTPPLFQGAITSSTFLPSQYNYDDAMPESLYNQTASLSGCDASEDSLACLRGLEASALQEINAALCASGFQGTFVFVPVVDGTFIKERPSVTFRRGRLNGKRLLAVTNTHEGRMFVNPNATWLETENYASQLFPLFGPSQASAAAIVYRSFSSDYDKASAIMGESIFTCPTYFLLEAFKGPSYKGHFAVPPANHAGDVAYYYPSNGLPAWNNLEFRKAFSEAFLSFVMTGDPNARRDPETTPEWRRWSSSNPVELLFNSTEAGDAPQIEAITTARDLRRRCDFWERVVGLSGQ
ncbi:carotenoid ester lipase [Coprinopsis cinerea AmutBmut pab1-1]|nr:carotenoid ester lipase [Coprinopsis cinerea AmutBmut pab1-1]